MAGRVEGKVAFITGAARGQGRSHAVTLAREGADIIAVDLCDQISTVPYELSKPEDLEETVRQVEALDRRIVAQVADVRDVKALRAAVDAGVAELGRLDIVSANAGIVGPFKQVADYEDDEWQNMIDVNLTGVANTCRVSIPHIRAGGRGGSIILTSSMMGLRSHPNSGNYAAAKHGVTGLMRTLALELAPDMIRVNSLHPTQVETDMIMNQATYDLFQPAEDRKATVDDFAPVSQSMNALPIPWVDVSDVSNALLWLASDEARYITGVPLPVDAGCMVV